MNEYSDFRSIKNLRAHARGVPERLIHAAEGDEFPEPHMSIIDAGGIGEAEIRSIIAEHESWEELARRKREREKALERHVPLPPGLTADEIRQHPMPANGLTIAAALVAGCALAGLLRHAAARAGWL